MPPKSKPVGRSRRVVGKKIVRKANRATGKIKRQRLEQTGVNSRIRGHVSARGKRAQARRDSR